MAQFTGLFMLFAVILIGWAALQGIKKYANKYPPVTTGCISGVGGWLLFLVFRLMFIDPLLGTGYINKEIMSAESQYPELTTIAAWTSFKFAAWLTHIVSCLLGIYAGIGLAIGRTPSVVNRAKLLLWVVGPFTSAIMGVALPIIYFGELGSDSGASGYLIGTLIGSIIATAIWTTYLSKSKRVQATYGTNLSTHSA